MNKSEYSDAELKSIAVSIRHMMVAYNSSLAVLNSMIQSDVVMGFITEEAGTELFNDIENLKRKLNNLKINHEP